MNRLRVATIGTVLILAVVAVLSLMRHTAFAQESDTGPVDFGDFTQFTSIAVSDDGTSVQGYSEADLSFEAYDYVDFITEYGALDDGETAIPDEDPDEYPDAYVDIPVYTDGSPGYGMDGSTEVCYFDDEDGEDDCEDFQDLYVKVNVNLPQISSISPSSGITGGSGTITVQGSNLQLPAGPNPGVSVSGGSGLHLSVNSASSSQVTLHYNIDAGSSPAIYSIYLSTALGISNTESFTVSAPATVTSVSPSVWPAGTTFSVNVIGTNFGSSPTATVNGVGISPGTWTTASDGTHITIPVSVSIDAPSETVSVEVQPGTNGNGFTCGTACASQPSGSSEVTISPVPAAIPIIVSRNGGTGNCSTDPQISGNQTVTVGQPIGVTGCIPIDGGSTISGSSWTPDGQFATATVGGFVITHTKVGTMDQFAESIPSAVAPTCGTNASCDFATFYFIQAGTYNFSFQYSLENGQSSPPQTVTYTVSAPTAAGDGTFMSATTLLADVWNEQATGDGFWLKLGFNASLPGIQFSATANPPGANGAWLFTQLLKNRSDEHLLETGTLHYIEPDGLDTLYPYSSTNGRAVDAPGTQLDQQGTPEGEMFENFGATMYLLWDPQTPPAGQQTCSAASSIFSSGTVTYIPSNCVSIPVPVASTTWGWSATAIKTLDPTQTNTQGVSVGTWYSPTRNVLTPQNGPSGYPLWNVTSGAKARHLQ